MAEQRHVFVGAFSKKALTQLKKTFELSAEERFEARKVGGDSMAGGAGKSIKKGGILRAVAGLALVLANLIVWTGTLLTGIFVGFIGEIKRLLTLTTLSKWIGKKWDGLKKDFKARWTKLIDAIKGSKVVQGISNSWKAITLKLSAVFTPILEWMGVTKAGPEVQGPKQQGRLAKLMSQFKAFLLKWPRTLAVGKALGRFIPWLWPMILVWESINGLVEGWKDAKTKDPDATLLEKLQSAVFGEKGFVAHMWDFLIVQTGNILGIISQWITKNLLRLFGFDKAADKIAAQDWNWGDMIEKIRLKIWDFLGLGATPEKDSIFWKIFQAFDDIGEWWKKLDIGAEIIKALKKLRDIFLGIFKSGPDPSAPPEDSGVVDNLGKRPGDPGYPEGPGVVETAKNIGSKIKSTAGKGIDTVKGVATDIGQTFTGTSKSLITSGISGAKAAKKKVDALINTITSWNPFSGGDGEVTTPILTMPDSWKKRSSGIVSGLKDSAFGSRIKDFVSKMWNEYGVDAQIYSGERGRADQEAAYKSGHSKATFGKSLHNYGAAVDFFFGHKGAKSDWVGPWDLAGKVARSLGLRWGGDFKEFKDRPHLQINKNWQEAAKSGLPLSMMAKGGIITKPQLALIGEGLHPEAVIPLPNFRPGIDPANQTSIMRGMGADVSVGGGFGGGGGGMAVVDSSTSVHNSTVLAIGNGPLAPAIDDGLNI